MANQQVAYGINGLGQYHFLAAHQQQQAPPGQTATTQAANGTATTSQAAANSHALAAAQNAAVAAAAAHGQTGAGGPMLIPFLQNPNDDVSNLLRSSTSANYSHLLSNF